MTESRGRKSKGRGQQYRSGQPVTSLNMRIMKAWERLPVEVKFEVYGWSYEKFKHAYKAGAVNASV